jgi:hypothetical protein
MVRPRRKIAPAHGREGPAMPLSIRNLKRFEKNTRRGFFDLELASGMVLCGCTLHERGDSRWVGLPAKPYTDKDGKQTWSKIVDFIDNDHARRFQDAVRPVVIEAFEREAVHGDA